jgi:predicted DNA-binding transcriptional regulator AlpA
MATAINKLVSEALLNERDVANLTGLSLATIRRRRLLRQPPKWHKLSASVRYRREDIEQWIASCAVDAQARAN